MFYAAAIFARDQVDITGETRAYEGRHFCPNCGGSVFAVSGGEVELYLGALDDQDLFTPSYELWCDRRAGGWLPAFPDTTCFRKDRGG